MQEAEAGFQYSLTCMTSMWQFISHKAIQNIIIFSHERADAEFYFPVSPCNDFFNIGACVVPCGATIEAVSILYYN